MANDLSTPSLGLEVQSTKADMHAGPSIDINGYLKSQPDYQDLGASALSFAENVFLEYEKASAKEALFNYQQKLGDINRSYLTGHYRGSPEEMRELQNQTTKAWNEFNSTISKFDHRVRQEVIPKANDYGVRYRDSLLNAQAKFVDNLAQQNLMAAIGVAGEDYANALDDQKSPDFQRRRSEFLSSIREQLEYMGYKEGDAFYDKTMEDTVSTATLANIKFHVANDDYDQGWANYTEFVKQGLLNGKDRTSALDMLKILKDELKSKSDNAGQYQSDLMAKFAVGATNAREDQEVALWKYNEDVPLARERVKAVHDAWVKQKQDYEKYRAQNGSMATLSGAVVTVDGKQIDPPGAEPPAELTEEDTRRLWDEAQAWVAFQKMENAKKASAEGAVFYKVEKALRAIPVEQRKLITNVEDFVKMTGLYSSPEAVANVTKVVKAQFGSEKELNNWLYRMQYGIDPSDSNVRNAVNEASNMTASTYTECVEQALDEHRSVDSVIAERYKLPMDRATTIANQKSEAFYTENINEFRDWHDRFIKEVGPSWCREAAVLMGFKKNDAQSRTWQYVNQTEVNRTIAKAVELTLADNAAFKGLTDSRDKMRLIYSNQLLQKKVHDHFKELIKQKREEFESDVYGD